LPHIAKELRLVLFAKSVSEIKENGGQESIRDIIWLFRDPIGYFAEMSSARQIIGIQGNDDDDWGDDSPENNDQPIKPFYPNDNKNINDEEEPQLHYIGGGKHIQTEKSSLGKYCVYSGNPAFRVEFHRLSWLFRPLNVQEKLPMAFYNDVRTILHQYEDDWNNLLSDDESIDRLRKIYDLYIGRRGRNAHSLLLRHEPEQYSGLFAHDCKYRKYRCNQCRRCFEFFCKRSGRCDNAATVLLGDLELDGKARAVLEKQRFIDDKTSIVLIPHHGANSDDLVWLDEKVRGNGGCDSLVVSYGINNRYKHPCFIYDGTMPKLKNPVAFVNEDDEYHYAIHVHD